MKELHVEWDRDTKGGAMIVAPANRMALDLRELKKALLRAGLSAAGAEKGEIVPLGHDKSLTKRRTLVAPDGQRITLSCLGHVELLGLKGGAPRVHLLPSIISAILAEEWEENF